MNKNSFSYIMNKLAFIDQKTVVVGMFKHGVSMTILAAIFNASLKVVEDIIREKL